MRKGTELEYLALEMWREREMKLPERVRRLSPDKWDVWLGPWDLMLDEAREAMNNGRRPVYAGAER